MFEIKDYIVVVDQALSIETCDKILQEYSQCDDWSKANVLNSTDNYYDKDFRNCDTIGLSIPTILEKNPLVRKEIDDLVFEGVSKCLETYRSKFKYANIISDTGYDLLRYNVGEYFKEHADSNVQAFKTISCSIALNEEYEGGLWNFFGGEFKLDKIPKGSAVLFPSNFCFPHEITTVTKGQRYSIVTWFV